MSLADRRYVQKHKPGKHNRKKFTPPPKPNAQLRKELRDIIEKQQPPQD